MSLQVKILEVLKRDREHSTRSWKDYSKKPRVYMSLRLSEGVDFNAVDDFFLRKMHKPAKLKPIVVDELKKHGIIVNKIRWSVHAGCSCPCSPGFILEDISMLNAGNPSNGFASTRFDVWMNYTLTEEDKT